MNRSAVFVYSDEPMTLDFEAYIAAQKQREIAAFDAKLGGEVFEQFFG